MPIYRYRCQACGHQFKLLLSSLPGETVETCEQCGAAAAQRLLAHVATIYKGSGFYTTSDYRKHDLQNNHNNNNGHNGAKDADGSATESNSQTAAKSSDQENTKGAEQK